MELVWIIFFCMGSAVVKMLIEGARSSTSIYGGARVSLPSLLLWCRLVFVVVVVVVAIFIPSPSSFHGRYCSSRCLVSWSPTPLFFGITVMLRAQSGEVLSAAACTFLEEAFLSVDQALGPQDRSRFKVQA